MPLTRPFFPALALLLGLALCAAHARAGEPERLPRADNVIFFLDHSGSMNMSNPRDGRYKIVMAKDLLAELGRELPPGFADVGLYTFGPYTELLSPRPHEPMAFAKAVAGIRTDYRILGRRTPMGQDLAKLDNVIRELPGTTALVILSDGYSNLGADPVAELEKLYSKYGGNLQVHIINYADKKRGVQTIKGLRKLSAPFAYTWGDLLLDNPPARTRFIEQALLEKPKPPLDPPMIPAGAEPPEPKELELTVRLPPPDDPFAPVPQDEPVKPAGEKVEAGAETIVLRHWRMGFGRADIPEAMLPALVYVLALLAEHPEVRVVVEGHTDNLGARDYNLRLSRARAEAVRDWLLEAGIDPDRIRAAGLGPDKPMYDNTTRIGRSLNRRVVIRRDTGREGS